MAYHRGDDTVDGAATLASAEHVEMLQERYSLSPEEAFMLISMRGDVRVGQSARCGLQHTARVAMSKEIEA